MTQIIVALIALVVAYFLGELAFDETTSDGGKAVWSVAGIIVWIVSLIYIFAGTIHINEDPDTQTNAALLAVLYVALSFIFVRNLREK